MRGLVTGGGQVGGGSWALTAREFNQDEQGRQREQVQRRCSES